jgi:tetratricopeptide (TPR) repeat protein
MDTDLFKLLNSNQHSEVIAILGRRKQKSTQELVIEAIAFSNLGNLEKSQSIYLSILKKDPENFDALNNLGNQKLKLNKFNEAIPLFAKAYRQVGAIKKNRIRAAVNAAVAAHTLGDLAQERQHLDWALGLDPEDPLALRAMGVYLLQVDNIPHAIEYLHKAVNQNKSDHEACANLSAAYARAKNYELSEQWARQALQINPSYSIAKANLGIALNSLDRFDEAYQYLLDSLNDGLTNYFNVYQGLAQVELQRKVTYAEAEDWIRKAHAIAPEEPSVLRTMGDVIARQNRKQSLQWFEKALAKDPSDTLTRWNLSLNYLACGDFERGWTEYECGFQREKQGRGELLDFNCPQWQGEPLAGKTIIVWGEQGVGDIVMFSHCLNEMLAEEPKLLVLLLPARLIEIYSRSFPSASILPYEAYERIKSHKKRFDFHTPIASTFRWKRNTRSDFAGKPAYLKPDLERVEYFRQKYDRLRRGRVVIGISWRAGVYVVAKTKKTIGLENLKKLVNEVDAFFVSFQYGDVEQEINQFNEQSKNHIFFDPEVDGLKDITTWFDQICSFDNLVSVATAGIHFAGAAGKEGNVLVPRGGNFNWQEDDVESLWYPNIKIYRQTKRFDWQDPIQNLSSDLVKRYSSMATSNGIKLT